MSRIAASFQRLKSEGRKALIPYVTAGDPNREATLGMMHAMVDSGADLIELGVPFSDPMADGPVIQKASERALAHGTSLRDVLTLVSQFRQQNTTTPVVLMGYLNPIEVMGYDNFAAAAHEAGVDGVLTVDLPPEEADDLLASLRKHQLDPIFLLAPTTDEQRVQKICALASGFVYYVSLKGVTGAANLDLASVQEKLIQIRRHTDLPVGVGFGIKDAETAAQVAGHADAVVVGSAVVKLVEHYAARPDEGREAVARLLAGMRKTMDGK